MINKKNPDDLLNILTKKYVADIMIYEWIACSKFLIPSLSVRECCISFLEFHGSNGVSLEISLDKMVKTYNRINAELQEKNK